MNEGKLGSFGAVEYQEPDILTCLFYALLIFGGGFIVIKILERMK